MGGTGPSVRGSEGLRPGVLWEGWPGEGGRAGTRLTGPGVCSEH